LDLAVSSDHLELRAVGQAGLIFDGAALTPLTVP